MTKNLWIKTEFLLTYEKIYLFKNEHHQFKVLSFPLIGTFFKTNVNKKEILLRNSYSEIKLNIDKKEKFIELVKWLNKLCISTNFYEVYEKIELIGKGGFGTVYKVQNKKTNEYFAAKVLDKKLVQTKTKGFMSLKNEIKILRMLDSEYLVRMEGMFESS